MNPIVLIPARMASTRLPDKPLAPIGGRPMIVCVSAKVEKAGLPWAVACDGKQIAEAVEKAGGRAILTDPALPSGSDRIWAALQKLESEGKTYDIIINVQGDMPTLDPAIIQQVLHLLDDPKIDIATLAAPITEERERIDPAVVKPVIDLKGNAKRGRAINFTRASVAATNGVMYHHIGIYAYRRAALEKFVSLPPSPLEKKEKLEQLRAMEAGMHIEVGIVDTVPLGVDTPETLEIARKWYEQGR